MKSRVLRFLFLPCALLATAGASVADEPSRADLTERQSSIGDKRFEGPRRDLPLHEGLMDKRFPMESWHGKFSPLGQRRAPIEVSETRDKRMIRPEVREIDKLEWGMARQNQQMAYLRNFDHVQEKTMVRRYEEAEVGAVRREHPDLKVEGKDFSMRDLNRFSFQRNHSAEGGLKEIRAGSEGESDEGDADRSSEPNRESSRRE